MDYYSAVGHITAPYSLSGSPIEYYGSSYIYTVMGTRIIAHSPESTIMPREVLLIFQIFRLRP